ncbi:MAG: hypothetical protein FalmKO_06650 [Falsiruegeria mediterranea]
MLIRISAIIAVFAVSDCSYQTSALPRVQSGPVNASATQAAQGTCSSATFLTEVPTEPSKVWFEC